MQNKDGKQKGPQEHAEGTHGSKTRKKILEQLQSGNGTVQRRKSPNQVERNGNHRLVEDRQQHDDGEKKSEKTRLNREVERGNARRPHIDSETT
jgi:hypothetical protein